MIVGSFPLELYPCNSRCILEDLCIILSVGGCVGRLVVEHRGDLHCATSTSTPSDASSSVAIRHLRCVFDVLGRPKSRSLLLSGWFRTTGTRLADVGSFKCDMICSDVSKTAACETFAELSDADCNDMLFALRLHPGPRDLRVRAAMVIG
jgi:hypothetical protein